MKITNGMGFLIAHPPNRRKTLSFFAQFRIFFWYVPEAIDLVDVSRLDLLHDLGKPGFDVHYDPSLLFYRFCFDINDEIPIA